MSVPSRRAAVLADLADVGASFVAARVAVLGALALTGFLGVPHRVGLLGWDAGHYRFIAEHGYPASAPGEARFFPLVPLLARAVAALPGVSTGAALLVVANAGALVYALLLVRLVRQEGLDRATATRTVWLLALAPPAFVLVMGYSESVYGALVVAMVAALRRGRWAAAAGAGLLAGTTRPVAALLALVALVEVSRGLPSSPAGRRPGDLTRRAAAVVSPLAGTAAYLLWTGLHSGDPLLPFRLQEDPALRGAVVADPVVVSYRLVRGLLTGHAVGSGLHVGWLLLFLVLLVPMVRLLPASYTVLAASTLLLAATSGALESLERYAWAAFPFVLVVARLTSRPTVYSLVLVASTVGLVGYALLAFAGAYVP